MSLIELAQNFPDCPHLMREQHACSWLSGKLGRIAYTSPIFCNFECINKGPYCGQAPKQEEEFIYNAWFRATGIDINFARRILNHYNLPANIVIPPEWSAIKSGLAHLYKDKNLRAILLTGSVITDLRRPLKDYDIALWFYDIKPVIINNKIIRDGLPKEINGVKADYFFLSGEKSPDTFFISLDPESKIMYTSHWFDSKKVSVSSDISVCKREPNSLYNLLEKAVNGETNEKITGLGDAISAVTHAVGIKECAGCQKRRETLNKLVPF
jgi:hypothetical protein